MDPYLYIKEHMHVLTKQEQQVASYVVAFPEEAVTLNAKEIGEKTNTSSATVIRFIKKMNYKGLSDFKVNLSRHLPDEKVQVLKKIDKNESILSLKEKLFARAQYSMEMTSQIIEDKSVEKLVTAIEQAKCIIVYGIGASHLVAQDFYQKFLRLGLNVQCTLDTHMIAGQLGAFQSDALFVGISSGGNNEEIQKLNQLAKTNQSKTALITSHAQSDIAKTSDILLEHDASTEESLRYAATSSLMSQLYVIDVLFYAYLVKHYDKNMHKVNATKEAVRAFRKE